MAAAAAAFGLSARGSAAAEPVKTAAIYTVPIEQQWVSRIHKAANAAKAAEKRTALLARWREPSERSSQAA